MSQKSRFKMQTQGVFEYRRTFPQLPWGTIKNPEYIQTAHGYIRLLFLPYIFILNYMPLGIAFSRVVGGVIPVSLTMSPTGS
jgi:hypothetical protein